MLSLRAALGASASETLGKADQALAGLNKVEYVLACYRVGDGAFGDVSRKTIARVKQERSEDDSLPYFWARVNIPRSNLVGELIQEISYDGSRLGVIDHARKVCTHGTYENAASNAGSFLSIVLFREFTQKSRARLSPGGGSVRLLGSEEVAGIPCDVLEVIGPAGGRSARMITCRGNAGGFRSRTAARPRSFRRSFHSTRRRVSDRRCSRSKRPTGMCTGSITD